MEPETSLARIGLLGYPRLFCRAADAAQCRSSLIQCCAEEALCDLRREALFFSLPWSGSGCKFRAIGRLQARLSSNKLIGIHAEVLCPTVRFIYSPPGT